ncbi:MAG TPA: hypothetical protein VI072_12510 [Polyangiaceae bacterium]
MLNAVSFQPAHIPFQAEESGATEQQPKLLDAQASRAVGSSGDTPSAPALPPWLAPNNFDFLRRVAHVVAAQRESTGGQ